MKRIPLSQGYVSLVDDEDFEWLSQFKWSLKVTKKNAYAQSCLGKKVHKGHQPVTMHRLLMIGPPQIDHWDGNGLNNQRGNLRAATSLQNMRNQPKYRGISQYKGAYWCKVKKRWYSRINLNNRSLYLGYFPTEEAAARAYDAKARELFGEFARLNFPEVAA